MSSFESVLKSINSAKVIDSISYEQYVPIDLSVDNKNLPTDVDSAEFEHFITRFLTENNAKIAFGGYNEIRNLYKRSELFNDDESEERNIHIGLDLWIKAGTSVLAPIDGKIHNFDFNSGNGNYGPTIILEHSVKDYTFYTLYGHLSIESIESIEIGDTFSAGSTIATLGDSSINGDYAPHLHFQIIKNIDGYFGDYPGVCNSKDLMFYLENCPDPNLLLKIN